MKQGAWRYPLAVVILAGTLIASNWNDWQQTDRLFAPLESIPYQISGWTGNDTQRLTQAVEDRLLATAYLTRTYRRENRQMSVLITYYSQQRAGESMHSPKNCLPGAGWEPWAYRAISVPVGSQQERVNLYSIQKNGTRLQVLYWYQSRDRVIANEYTGKLYLLWDALADGRTSGTLVRLTLPDTTGAVDEAVRFASVLIPEVKRCLGSSARN